METVKIYKSAESDGVPLYNLELSGKIAMNKVDITSILEFLNSTDCEVKNE